MRAKSSENYLHAFSLLREMTEKLQFNIVHISRIPAALCSVITAITTAHSLSAVPKPRKEKNLPAVAVGVFKAQSLPSRISERYESTCKKSLRR